MKRAAAALFLSAACAGACARSLRAPPTLAAMAPASNDSGEVLLARADDAWSRRAEPAQAAAAEELYLEAARANPADPSGYAGAVRAKAFQLGRETAPAARRALAESAVAVGQRCQENLPAAAVCDYWLAAALGLQAREREATAHDALPHIVELLRRAKASDPAIDRGGPARLLALVLLRAPGWPLGPGDDEAALPEAQAAATLAPRYPPNQLALGEALDKNGHAAEARAAYAQALRLAEGSDDPDAAGWATDARAALH